MIAPWTITGLLRDLTARGRHPAIVAFGEDGTVVWDSEALADKVLRLARGLREAGAGKGSRVALWAPNSPVWIAAALAVLAAGGVLVPIDDLASPEQLDAALASSGAGLILTSARHLEESRDIIAAHTVRAILVDAAEAIEQIQAGEDLPAPDGDEPAILSWTSGTTGSPKAFLLTHRNIASNVEALQELAVVGPHDRALLPLPLHHVYPFIVGMLTTLTLGTAIVFPAGATGPLLMRALREGQVTAIIGVPRLYDALLAGIATRVAARAPIVRLAWRALLRLAIIVQQGLGLPLGRFVFAPLRRQVAPRLRLLVSGGARLERETEEQLEAIGWTALSGYGLAETASLFTGNRPNSRRAGSAGRPLADGRVRIAEPDDEGIGEIELHGTSITKGYLDNPEANRTAFTADGWFRTGDLGFVDRDGFLFVTGRAKELLVLGGGKKVIPEDLERVYGNAPEIIEIAVLEDKGALVALVRPDPVKLRDRGATNFRDGIRIILAEKAQELPSYQRLSGFALTDRPFPRTRLGKYRRFLLPALYAEAQTGSARRAVRQLTPQDAELLRDPTADAVYGLLRQRDPDRTIDLDDNLSLDLNLDSFGWMEFATILQDRLSVNLSETDIAGVETVRDLLHRSIERRGDAGTPPPNRSLEAMEAERWLAPKGVFLTALSAALYGLNWLVMRGCFRLRVSGSDRLPETGPFLIAPNHASDLDGMAIAAALPWSRFRRVFWAGDLVRLFSSPPARLFCRAMQVYPVDARHPGATLEAARRVLKAGDVQVWFAEAWRSPDGQLQRFLAGVGQLLLQSRAPAVPAYIGGAFAALPRSRRIPKLHRITVTFGSPEPADALRAGGSGRSDEERIANALRQRVLALGVASGIIARETVPGSSGAIGG